MEGDPRDSDDDLEPQERSSTPHSAVLWEKCFQQSIFVDLSEDESIHLSDLERSFAVCLSQAESAPSEASIHFSGNLEFSGLAQSSSEYSSVSSQSERVVEGRTKSSMPRVSAQRHNTMQEEPLLTQVHVDPGDTSDEDQEELPFDGDLGSPYFNHTTSSEGTSNRSAVERDHLRTLHPSPNAFDLSKSPAIDKDIDATNVCSPTATNLIEPATGSQMEAVCTQSSFIEFSSPGEGLPLCSSPVGEAQHPDVSQFLLRHFAQEELLCAGRLIEAETLPEVSLMESIDDTFVSRATERSTVRSPRRDPHRTSPRSNAGSPVTDDVLTGVSKVCSAASPSEEEEEGQAHRVPLERTRSFSELKYGQGQVHYPLPDFSKVASKVKTLMTPSGPVRPVSQSPTTFTQVQSSPGMLGMSSASRKAAVEIINVVLEDSAQPLEKPYVFHEQDYHTDPAAQGLVNYLQVEYDKLLTKYAEAENLIDQMRLGTKSTSDGERLTDELKDMISQFFHKVEAFKICVVAMSVSVEEQQTIFKSMMEAQDQLERKYLCKKEEHRALEMQNYMGLARNTGTFDPERLVEGDIFRVGMYLEDIKDRIDRNLYEQLTSPHSSPTPTPLQSLCSEPSPPFLLTTPPPPILHEEPSPLISTRSYNTKEEEEEEQTRSYKREEEEEEEHTSEVLGGLERSSNLTPSDSLQSNSRQPVSHPRTTPWSLEGLDLAGTEEEVDEGEGFVVSKRIEGDDTPACLTRPTLFTGNGQWTPESSTSRAQPSGLPWEGVCDLGASGSSVEVSSSSHALKTQSLSEPTLNISQSVVSPETDSGFGSSDLSRLATALRHQKFTRQSGLPQANRQSASESDSEGSNLLTTIHPASPHVPSLGDPFGSSAVSVWLSSSTSPEAPARLHEPDPQLPRQLSQHHPEGQSDPVLSITMDTEVAPQRETPPTHTCACNSEAILSLQSEVSRLKRDLEEGLVQLPHLAQRMDHLTTTYRQERRAKTRPKTHHQKQLSTSVRKTPLSRSERPGGGISPSLVKMEDWISSDLEPSRSKAAGDLGEGVFSKGKLSHLNPQPLQPPLLQVNYGSSCSLPAGFKVKEPPLQSVTNPRRRSTQSDTALLPSNVYFQRTLPPTFISSKAGSRATRRKGSKEEEMSRTLDHAIEAARSMKRTTDRMAKSLSADLAKAQLHRNLNNIQRLGTRGHSTS
ncbi:uncharacterized protein aknad1 [Aplochiton taeniatus]